MNDLTFRPACPRDVDSIVPLIIESSRPLIEYNFRIGAHEPRTFLARDFLRGEGLFGYRNQIVGVSAGGEILSTITAYPGSRFRRLSLETTISAFRHFGVFEFLTCLSRSLAMAALFITPKADALFLANACVHQKRRGTGIFSRLIEHVMGMARGLGLRSIELDVSFANASVQKKYEHLGFSVTGEKPYIGKKPLDGFRRMEKALV